MAEKLAVRRRRDGSLGLMGHVIADFPSPAAVRTMIATIVAAGAEVIEIQIPFSEPMADGPVFLAANHQALAQGVDYAASLALMREVAGKYPQCAFVFMTYLNVVYKRGFETFAAEAAAAGARGVIIPDLPLEHAGACDAALRARGLVNVRLVAPNTPDARVAQLTRGAEGLVYAVARAGVTGSASDFGEALARQVARIRAGTEVAVAVGFGVRQGADVARLRGVADLAIVGTASLVTWQEQGEAGFKRLWRELGEAAQES